MVFCQFLLVRYVLSLCFLFLCFACLGSAGHLLLLAKTQDNLAHVVTSRETLEPGGIPMTPCLYSCLHLHIQQNKSRRYSLNNACVIGS